MSIVDVNADFLGVKRLLLMENAGKGLADFIWEVSQETNRLGIVIIAGKGGNGGDGMVAARHLAKKAKVSLYLIGEKRDIKKESTRKNWQILENMSHSLCLDEVKDSTELDNIKIHEDSIIIDAIFGTGVHGNVRGLYAKVIEKLNSHYAQGGIIISVDTPSGVDPNTGKRANLSINAHHTVVFHKQKKGLNVRNSGKIKIVPIGIPPEAEFIAGPGDLLAISDKSKWQRKGDQGKVLIIGGNEKYSGAPALSAMGALNAGSDLVTIFAPEQVTQAIRSYTPEFIVVDYPHPHLTSDSIPYHLIENTDSIVLGPGLGRHSDSKIAVKEILKFSKTKKIPIVIDADALHMINQKQLYSGVILTPHAGEFAVLSGKTLPSGFSSFARRIEEVRSITQNSKAVWLVKGPWDIISDSKRYKINKTGIPEMSRGGTGDILAGLAACYANKTSELFYAASIAAFINGKAGELAFREFSTMNLVSKIPEAIQLSWDFINED